MFKAIQSDFYGDEFRWFIGIIEDIADPERLGRVRVRIFGVHNPDVNQVPLYTLPWAQVVMPVTEEGVSGLGSNTRLKQGAQVFGIFLDGKQSQMPLVLGSIPGIVSPNYITQNQRFQDNANVASNREASTDGGYIPVDGAVGTENEERAFNFFISTGLFSPEQSAGIVGNLIQESGVDPMLVSGFAGENSQGIAQWNPAEAAGNRLGLLKTFAGDRNLDWRLLDTQLQFIIYELENYSYLGMSELQQASTIEQATRVFSDKYERPGIPNMPRRINEAKRVYETYYVGG